MTRIGLTAAIAAAAALTALPAGAGEPAGCAPGESDAKAVQEVEQTGTTVYETYSGFGVTGSRGYLEVSLTEDGGAAHGRTTTGQDDLDSDGRAHLGPAGHDVCLNGTDV